MSQSRSAQAHERMQALRSPSGRHLFVASGGTPSAVAVGTVTATLSPPTGAIARGPRLSSPWNLRKRGHWRSVALCVGETAMNPDITKMFVMYGAA